MSKNLFKAAETGDFKAVEKLLKLKKKEIQPGLKHKAKGIDVDFRDKTRKTPLMVASMGHFVPIMEALLLCSAPIDSRDVDGNSALHLAVQSKAPESVLKVLLSEKDINIDIRNKLQDTPLHVAARIDNTVAMVILLQAGANCRIYNAEKQTCLDVASIAGHAASCGIIVEEPGMTRSYGALYEALKQKNLEVARSILEAGMDSQIRDDDHNTPLHLATENNDYAMCELLIRHHASHNLANGKNQSALNIAVDNGFKKIAELFENADAVPKFEARKKEIHTRGDTRSYPLMKSKIYWVGEDIQFCSASSGKMWALVDGDKDTCCDMLYNADRKNYFAFDLQRPYNISGIRILGNASTCMLKYSRLEKAESWAGPWTIVSEVNLEKLGAEDYKSHAGVPQEVTGFHSTSRYFRLLVQENYGGFMVALNQIAFYGVDTKCLDLLEKYDIYHLLDNLLNHGYAHAVDWWLLRFREDELREICNGNTQDIIKLRDAVRQATDEENKLTYLGVGEGGTFPLKHIQDKRLPELIIEGNPGTDEEIELFFEGCGNVEGVLKTHLVPDTKMGGPSKAKFKNIKIHDDGEFYYGIRSVDNPDILCGDVMYDIQIDLHMLGKNELLEQVSTSMALFDI